ncbi:quinone oxidoreductase family protein [Dictyobacter kobayashii]|uniref:Quinone oxidoreductase n=1 Tax=Dictyobacter kobayashii TaxID=2014872 RepID=A0A402AE02_9CHLR|nr:zinc-binding dehydrogenase [Dictyobacter kobayashii]GCE17325.1 quinone oxidoreductase [Dictyobacter kobayashii]
MKAIRIQERGAIDVMKVTEIERPQPAQGQVLIKVAVAGINYADIGQRTGAYPYLMPLPLTLGFEAAGVIEEVGAGVSELSLGTRVVSLVDGGYAEYALANATDIIVLPEAVSFAEAVMIPVQGQTAYLALQAARLHQGDQVLVHSAAGGVGSIAIQLAKLLGASTVIGTTTSAEKVEYIRSLGADVVINTKDASWVEQVLQATGGRGVDVLLETIGGEIGQQSLGCIAPFGRMMVYGTLTGAPTLFAAQALTGKCISVIGYNTNIQSLADQMHASHELLKYISSKQLHVIHDSAFPLDRAVEAHQAIQAGKTRGKVILTN